MNFSAKIELWYGHNKRDLPWRNTSDPYRIWLSEIILQQTRIDQGLSYFNRFVEAFPDIRSLAAAPEELVLKHWQGLGYYTRARNLHRTAIEISEKYNGLFPGNYENLILLPGIGDYTASAILSMTFNKPYPVLDGNVFRVITRLFSIHDPVDSGKGKNRIREKALELMDYNDPGTYNQAVMEFGALHCKPVNPDCDNCIFKTECLAFKKNEVNKLPVKKAKPVQRFRYFNYFLFCFQSNHSAKILINKREGNDIWKNLYDFPLIETTQRTSLKNFRNEGFNDLVLKNKTMKSIGNEYKHILSHQVILARFIRVDSCLEQLAEIQKNFRTGNLIPVEISDLIHFPVPRLIEKFLEENRLNGSSGE